MGIMARRCDGWAPTSDSFRWSSTAAPPCTSLSLLVTMMLGGNVMGGGLFSLFAPADGVDDAARGQRRVSGVRARTVVDDIERWLAPRQCAAHSLQHDVGARPGTADCGYVRRRAHGDHLHHLVRLRLPPELCHGLSAARRAASRRRGVHAWCVGSDLRSARSAGALWESRREQHDPDPCDQLRRDDVHFGLLLLGESTTTRISAVSSAAI